MAVLGQTPVRSTLAGLTVTCPPGWNAATDVGIAGVELALRDAQRALAIIRVTREPLSQALALQEYAERQLGLLRSHTDALRLVDDEPSELCGAQARRVLVAFRSGLAHLTGDQWWAVIDGHAVVVACACLAPDFPTYESTFEVVAETVTVTLAGQDEAREKEPRWRT